MEEKMYEVMDDANKIIKSLAERYDKVLWAVKPDEIVVLGVTNKERPKKMKKLATIRKITPVMRTVIRTFGDKDVNYTIEIYSSDWNQWSVAKRQWILFHEVLHIPQPDASSLIQHDVMEFGVVIDAVGVDYLTKDLLPDLLDGEPIKFRQELADRLHVNDDEASKESGKEE